MTFRLAAEAIASGYGLLSLDTIGSTNAEAMDRARTGAAAPLWVVSCHQTLGRGRRGSSWQTEPGNLAASLMLRPDVPPATLATLGFVAGVALVEALEDLAHASGASPSPLEGEGGLRVGEGRMRDTRSTDPSSVVPAGRHLLLQGEKEGPRFTLKWPNDVLSDGQKLAGILLETETDEHGRAVVVGIGVNVAHAPAGLPYRATSLKAMGIDASAERLFADLSAAWVATFDLWDEGRGFAAIRERWLSRTAGLGAPIRVRTGSRELSGSFDTIDEAGQLVLRDASGRRHAVSAGDVHFGDAATARQEAAA